MERELVLVRDINAASDCLCAGLERIRLEWMQSAQDRRHWNEISRVFDVARQSVKCMLAVNGAEVNVVSEKSVARTPREALAIAMPIVSIIVGAVLTVWLIVKDMNIPASLAAMLTAIAWLETQVIYRRRLAVAAFSKVDRHELLRLLDRLMESMDYALEMSAQEAGAAVSGTGSNEQPALTGDMLGSVQMLMEAVETRDGAYALKAVPALTAALMEQGIEIVKYTHENEEYFDLYPGTEKGITIRPALLKDGKVIARGQATEEME